MLNATNELFFSEYFLIKAILGEHLEDSRELFCKLGKIFLIPQEQIDGLYRLAENDVAKSITTESDFMQHQRIQKYSALVGSPKNLDAEWEKVVTVKGGAILLAQANKLVNDTDSTKNLVYKRLSAAVTSGMVIALRITGILFCEGIFFNKNVKLGVVNLAKAAAWNDKVSALASLYYSSSNSSSRDVNMARLGYGLEDSLFKDLYQAAVKEYGEPETLNLSEIKLLDKAFGTGTLKAEFYDRRFARILNSVAISVRDKERAIFSPSAELATVIGDLPLKLTSKKIVSVDTGAMQNVAIKREREVDCIACALKNGDIRQLSSSRPICLCCDSRYILNAYAKAIGATSADVHVETIDVAELIEYDFEPTRNNIFVRSVDEDKDNRFLLFFCGDISESKIEAVKSFLPSGRRARFYLNNPGVTLDLSAVLPICFCDKKNAQALEQCCDVIRVGEITQEEFPSAIADILASKAKLYGASNVELDGEARDIFSGFDVDTAEKLIDQAVRDRRASGAAIVLTRDIISAYSAIGEYMPRIGFGGENDDRNK